MKRGAAISGAMHAGFLAAAIFGTDWLSGPDPLPLVVTEIDLIDGINFEAAVSTAPVVPNVGPAQLAPPQPVETDPGEAQAAADATPRAPEPPQPQAPPPERPVEAAAAFPPPPTDVPTEAPAPSIAEIPVPDPLDRQSLVPESPPATEPVQPIASAAPVPQSKPSPPPPPDPEPVAEADPAVAETPDKQAEAAPAPDPEPAAKPEPESIAESQPDAPDGAAPRTSAIPVAKPADLAAAARAAARREAEARKTARTAPAKTPQKPATGGAASGSTATLAQRLTRGETDALRLGIKRYYTYNGNRSDRSLAVILRVQLDRNGTIRGTPELSRATGGTPALQRTMYQAARRALLRASANGVFRKLPAGKYARWKTLNFRFTIDSNKIGVSS